MALRERESKRSGKSKLKITLGVSSHGTSRRLSALPIYETAAVCNLNEITTDSAIVQVESTCLGLTSSAEDSPAKTSATPASEQESTANAADSGASMPASFANYDPATSSWKTSQLCLDGEWSEFLETWPRSGMTRSGRAFRLRRSVPRTLGKESGLLPTPEASNTKAVALRSAGRPPKSYLPTPRAIYGEHPGMKDPSHLTGAIHYWPTPTGITDTGGAALCKWGGSGARAKLRTMISETELNGALNPTWVEWLMGYPLGWTALEDSETPLSPKLQNGLEGES